MVNHRCRITWKAADLGLALHALAGFQSLQNSHKLCNKILTPRLAYLDSSNHSAKVGLTCYNDPESSPLTLFPLDSTFFPKTTQNHTQTDKNSIPSRWGESTHDLPSTPMRQHHGSIEINLNGLLANYSTCCSKEKMHINVVVIGHVDSGKSTTTGKPSQQPRSATRASCSHT